MILFDPARAWEFELRRKRGGHLFSKHRFLAAQMEAYLADGLWLDLPRAANARADAVARGIAALPGARLLHPVEANAVFAAWPRAGHRAAQAAGAEYYLWPADQSLDGPGRRRRSPHGWSATGRPPRPKSPASSRSCGATISDLARAGTLRTRCAEVQRCYSINV